MAKRKRKAAWPLPLVALGVLIISLLVLIEHRDALGLTRVLPSWDDIYAAVGLRDAVPTDADGVLASVHFIDVGQGDSTLIVSGGQTALVDAGESGDAQKVVDHLNSLGITRIDILVGTHPHSDHIGGLPRILDEFEVGRVILPQIAAEHVPTTRTYERLLTAIADRALPVDRAQDRRAYTLGDCTLMVLGPVGQPDNLNDYSAVVKIVAGGTSVLLCGDIEKTQEQALIDKDEQILRSTVLKVPHHGSRTSSSESFLRRVRPQLAIVSCGEGNSYDHPHNEIIERYEQRGVELLRTDKSGTIIVTLDGAAIAVETQK